MRIRNNTEQPPSKKDIADIIQHGVRTGETKSRLRLLERLANSCYLVKDTRDQSYRPLNVRERLLEQYKKDGLVLFLGAGVSCGSGIPNWNKLIEDVLKHVGINNHNTLKQVRVFQSLLAQFDLAGHFCRGGQMEFTTKLYECIYGRSEFKALKNLLTKMEKIRDKQALSKHKKYWDDLRKEFVKNKTLRDVGDLLILDDAENQPPRRNPQVHAVLTVNADNLLELYCLAKTSGKERLVTMVDRASVGDHPYAIPVYHLHGTLDARDENFRRTDSPCVGEELQPITEELLPRLVFRESEYYETIANMTSFVNHTPQSYFQRLNVLFIGTSLDDPNIRRWLYTSFRERVEQRTKYLQEFYCKKYAAAKFEAECESVRHFWLRTRTETIDDKEVKISGHTADMVELVMRKLGVQVVWCNDYSDMQRCIRNLKEKGQEPKFGRHALTR